MDYFFAIFVKILRRPLSLLGVFIILVLIFTAFFPGVITNQGPFEMNGDERLLPPSKVHFFGTDEMGRDIYSRVIHGGSLSLQAGAMAVLIAAVFGSFWGTLAGYFGKWLEDVIMRLSDIFLAFPPLVMAMAIVAVLGPSITNATIALGIIWWPQYTRVTCAQVASAKNLLYVEAARAAGIRTWKIMFQQILPNCAGPLIIKSTLDIGYAILYTASLSFMGLGATPPTPEWGCMVTMGRNYILDHWWYATFPGFAIFLAVLGFNLLGDGIRDALDPHLRL